MQLHLRESSGQRLTKTRSSVDDRDTLDKMGNSIYQKRCNYEIELQPTTSTTNQSCSSCSILPGQPLRGKLRVHVLEKIPPTGIQMRFMGKEKIRFRDFDFVTTDQRDLCQSTIALRDIGTEEIQPGTYVFDFEFETPSTIPRNMEYRGTQMSRNKCCIAYKLKVDLIVPRGEKQRILKAVAQKEVNVARKPLPSEMMPTPNRVDPIWYRLCSWTSCWVNLGYVAMAAEVSNRVAFQGGDLELFWTCRNDSSCHIYRLEISLEETVVMKGKSQSFVKKRNLLIQYKNKIPQQQQQQQQHNDKNGHGTTSTIWEKLPRKEVQKTIQKGGFSLTGLVELFDHLQAQENKMTISIPLEANDTFSSALIEVKHAIKVKAIVSNIKRYPHNPYITIPIHIGSSPLQEQDFESPEAIAIPVPQKPTTILYDHEHHTWH